MSKSPYFMMKGLDILHRMSTCETISTAEQINQLHSRVEALSSQSRTLLDEALSAAWQAGKLLLAEKQRVRRQMDAGSWLLWLIGDDLGERLVRLGFPVVGEGEVHQLRERAPVAPDA